MKTLKALGICSNDYLLISLAELPKRINKVVCVSICLNGPKGIGEGNTDTVMEFAFSKCTSQ